MALCLLLLKEINSYYDQLKLGKLDSHSGTPDVYIVTKRETLEEEKG
jgi:hypothetical protein